MFQDLMNKQNLPVTEVCL